MESYVPAFVNSTRNPRSMVAPARVTLSPPLEHSGQPNHAAMTSCLRNPSGSPRCSLRTSSGSGRAFMSALKKRSAATVRTHISPVAPCAERRPNRSFSRRPSPNVVNNRYLRPMRQQQGAAGLRQTCSRMCQRHFDKSSAASQSYSDIGAMRRLTVSRRALQIMKRTRL